MKQRRPGLNAGVADKDSMGKKTEQIEVHRATAIIATVKCVRRYIIMHAKSVRRLPDIRDIVPTWESWMSLAVTLGHTDVCATSECE